MESNKCPLCRVNNIVVQTIEDELLIYDFTRNKGFCLNKPSALIWQSCDGRTSVNGIALLLQKAFKIPVCEELVWLALDMFKSENLLFNAREIEIYFNDFTRREMIRRIGSASLIALPLMSGLILPGADRRDYNCKSRVITNA